MKYKTETIEGKTYIVTDEQGNPIVIDDSKPENDSDREIGLDAIHLYSKIPSLQAEAKGQREKKEAAEKLLKSFEGIEDPESARKALETVKSLEDKELVDAKKVEELKASLIKVEQEKYNEMDTHYKKVIKEKDDLILSQQNDIFDAMVSSQFSNSKWFSGPEPGTRLTPRIARDHFARNFKVEKINDKNVVVGYFDNGEKIYSKVKTGDLANFDEAITEIINKHPDKETFIQPSDGSGSKGSQKSKSTEVEKERLQKMKPTERLKEIRRQQEAQE